MAKFIELHFVLDGSPKFINVDNIFEFYPSVRKESERIDGALFGLGMPEFKYTYYDCTRIVFNVYDRGFDAMETYDEVYEKIKSVSDPTTIIEERTTNNPLGIDLTKRTN